MELVPIGVRSLFIADPLGRGMLAATAPAEWKHASHSLPLLAPFTSSLAFMATCMHNSTHADRLRHWITTLVLGLASRGAFGPFKSLQEISEPRAGVKLACA